LSAERIKDEMGLLERIAFYIPGYRGYKEKELRREADILVRRRVSGVLSECRSMLNSPLSPSAARRLAYDADAKFALENVRTELDRVVQRIDKAIAGYAGLFDAVKVREDRLDRVLSHDLNLIQEAEKLKSLVSELFSIDLGSDDWMRKLNEVRAAISSIDRLIDERVNILKGLTEVGD